MTPREFWPLGFLGILIFLGGCQAPGRVPEAAEKDRTALRSFDKALIETKVRQAKKYLLGVMDPQVHAFPKHYDARRDKTDSQLRTVFTASSLWTLIKLNDWEKDPRIQKEIPKIANFLLSMQAADGPHAGAFYYSLSTKTGMRKPSFVVGTASKTIFTLLELSRRFQDPKYLAAAEKAGDWLLRAQKPDGSLTTSYRFTDGEWMEGKSFSTLYYGQVLSAFSRLYFVTQNKKYKTGAAKLANLLIKRAKRQDYFLQDDYRLSDDPVPTSWGIMSLLDYHKAVSDPQAKEVLLRLTRKLSDRQFRDAANLLDHGRFNGTTATSGNGWIHEVFSEVYLYGKAQGWDAGELEKIKESILLVTRWLIQRTYSKENTSSLKNPQRAMGGLIRNFKEESVRTDAVCHGVNGYLNMLGQWPDGILLDLTDDSARILTHAEK